MKITSAKFALLLVALLFVSACAKKKKDFAGEYHGEANALLEPNYPNAPVITTEKSADAVANITQNGDSLTLEVTNSNILQNCKLTAKINPNGKAYVGRGTCDVKVGGQSPSVYFTESSITLGEADSNLTIDLLGLAGGDRFKFKFQGKK
ncbi:MAG TPA: hypothetical protein VJT71_10330 [Pyrinomonadaceae bacterium]|nr:hypothetical protein [Pyrinomonadaceae bacterium]